MSPSDHVAKKEATQPKTAPKVNPFPSMEFAIFDQTLGHLTGKNLPSVLEDVATHMAENNISAGRIHCLGQLKNTDRYFVNLHVAKETVPELEDTIGLTHLIHFESKKYPHIIVLKADALKN